MMKNVRLVAISIIVIVAGIALFMLMDDERSAYVGSWEAKWTTLPESFEGVQGITSFEMDGSFEFTDDSVTVTAMGFPGCVFGVDTLVHTQLWDVRNDSLFLISEPGINGITYQVQENEGGVIKMKLLDDIFLTLTQSK